jgi:RNA polymerase sigma factor (sigma-70 family)
MSHCSENPKGQPAGETRPEPTEAELLATLAAGRMEAFWNLWDRHQKPLRQLCLREMNRHAADAEDALSQVMLKARDRLPAAAAKIINLEAWLHRLARNLCIDLRRERQRRFEAAELWKITGPAESPSALPLLQHETEWEIQPFIAALPPPLRAAFELHLVREIPVQEVAAQLKLSPANVRKRVQLARERLRRDIENSRANEDQPPPVKKKPPGVIPVPSKPARHWPETWELFPTAAAIRTVRVPLPCGVEQLFHVFPARPPVSPGRKIKSLQNHLRQHPGHWKKQLELAALFHLTGDWDRAAGEWQGVLAQRPHLSAALKLGDTLLKLGRPEAAAAVFSNARRQPFQPAATGLHLAGWLAFCQKNASQSVREFQAAADAEPENPAHWHALALAHQRAGTLPEALRAINHALQLNANDLVALSLGHEILLAAGHIEEAIRRAERLLQLTPQDLLTLRRLIECRCQWELTEGAAGVETKRLLRRASRLSQNPFLMREPLAAFFLAQGEPQKALAVQCEFAGQHPQCPRGRKKYLHLLVTTGRTDRRSTEMNGWKLPPAKSCNGACHWHETAEPLRA